AYSVRGHQVHPDLIKPLAIKRVGACVLNGALKRCSLAQHTCEPFCRLVRKARKRELHAARLQEGLSVIFSVLRVRLIQRLVAQGEGYAATTAYTYIFPKVAKRHVACLV